MITKESLIAYGADYDKGIKICMNNEAFYFRLIAQALGNAKFADLETHLTAGDLKAAFEDAHALKGVCGNLSLTPLFDAVVEIVEPLRQGEQRDYAPLLSAIKDAKARLDALVAG